LHANQSSGLSAAVVYYDAKRGVDALLKNMCLWKKIGLSSIIVADNCEEEDHIDLSEIVKSSDGKLQLISIDYEKQSSSIEEDLSICLDRLPDEAIQEILRDAHPGMSDLNIQRIASFAQGYPQMAVLIGKASLNDIHDISIILRKDIVNRLISGRSGVDTDSLKVLSICSLFEKIGFFEDLEEQGIFIAENLCKIPFDEFYRIIQGFIKRGIIIQRQRYIQVAPRPLAIYQASEWWNGCSKQKTRELIELDYPGSLFEDLCSQLRLVDSIPGAIEFVRDICGEKGPFGQMEILISTRGSRIFNVLVEVNPEDTLRTLERNILPLSIDSLLNIGDGRRYLVWSLEKLCFWENTFKRASKVMLKFAIAENEKIGNNATNQFYQLFHYELSGTQAPLNLRIQLIEEVINKNDPDYTKHAIQALKHALETVHFHRTVGVELQGSRPVQEEWRPKKWNEVFDYWKKALDLLISLAQSDPFGYSSDAKEAITDNTRGLLWKGRIEEIEYVINQLIPISGAYWPEMRNALNDALSYDGSKYPPKIQARVQFLIEKVEPKTLEEKVEDVIFRNIRIWEYDSIEEYHKIIFDECNSLAIELSKEKPLLDRTIEYVLSHDAAHSLEFGQAVLNQISDFEGFSAQIVEILERIPQNKRHLQFFGGYLFALNQRDTDIAEKIIRILLNNPNFDENIIDIVCYLRPKYKIILDAVNKYYTSTHSTDRVRLLSYGGITSHLTPEEIKELSNIICKMEPDGAIIALDMLFMHVFKDDLKKRTCMPFFKDLFYQINFFSLSKKNGHHDDYLLENSIKDILSFEKDGQFVDNITKQIFSSLGEISVSLKFTGVNSIFSLIIDEYPDIFWKNFISYITHADYAQQYYFVSLFRVHSFDRDRKPGLIEKIDFNIMEKWCRESPEIGPSILMQIINPFILSDKKYNWNPTILYLIDEYGSNHDVLKDLGRNIGSFGWKGSISDYYELVIGALSELLDHKIISVREWAERETAHYKCQIDWEKRKDEESSIHEF
jgi:hypothetical protein